jgi:hypothetical protein
VASQPARGQNAAVTRGLAVAERLLAAAQCTMALRFRIVVSPMLRNLAERGQRIKTAPVMTT